MDKEYEKRIKKIIGEAIRIERERNGFTQAELAEESSLHLNFIGQVERGEKAATIISLYKICLALGLSMGDFLQQIKL
ncbi:XRE family transcriptional regulator [Neobacillus bataviensis LMG 21833]|uniref:XRE family transcriptional regulator n=1 Tax=Neobacillus bataviensis LMG 21833 TaxID=1117379 RepID=K6DM97_9BACI|nr:helix-turn-helix domain-containing protein [Neobacillus bataviensis]EKN69298.1 XRE family transcriptional regulator [Neobacillus bataviensis LMG 21833]